MAGALLPRRMLKPLLVFLVLGPLVGPRVYCRLQPGALG